MPILVAIQQINKLHDIMEDINIIQTLNSKSRNMQVDTQVITLADNLSHPYFSLIDVARDNYSPIGIAKIEAPYTPHIANYWIKYNGVIVISFNMVDAKKQNTNAASYGEAHELEQRIVNEEYNYSMICKISRFKQKGKKFIIYLEDIGWKFLQKVPKDFRDTYVAGQYLDDAFQAMCEFLNVDFAYSIEDLHEYTFAPDGYSVQKEGQTIEDVETVLSEWGTPATEEEEENEDDSLSDPMFEDQALIDLDKKNKNNKNYISNNDNDENNQTSENDTKLNEKQEEDDKQSLQDKIDKYQEQFDNKVLDLFKGNMYYESDLLSNVMDYSRITITPQAISTDTSNMSSVSTGDTANSNNNTSSNEKISLSYDQVNRMNPSKARAESMDTNKYYHTTILRLRARAAGKTVSATTGYAPYEY